MEIRQITVDERLGTMFPLQAYAFYPSPWTAADADSYLDRLRFDRETVSLVAEEDGEALACAAAIPMRQNVRGLVHPMAGIASVASHPAARRRGVVRALLVRLLRQMRDAGHPVSCLYPFKPSFYERFGYVGLLARRTAAFPPAGLGHLLRAELPGTVTRSDIKEGYADHRALTLRLLAERHGFSVSPDSRASMWEESVTRWVATARVDGEVVGAVTYRIERQGGDLVADDLLTTGPLGRALLLQFFARHVDQVGRVVVSVGPDEVPELWGTDLAAHIEARASFPEFPAPMARVLSVEALAGTPAGPGTLIVDVVDDELIGGRYRLDADGGGLAVTRDPGGEPGATLTSAGLSGLVFGVLDPVEVGLRGFGTVRPEAAAALRSLFPPASPYLYEAF